MISDKQVRFWWWSWPRCGSINFKRNVYHCGVGIIGPMLLKFQEVVCEFLRIFKYWDSTDKLTPKYMQWQHDTCFCVVTGKAQHPQVDCRVERTSSGDNEVDRGWLQISQPAEGWKSSVCLYVCEQDNAKCCIRIWIKFLHRRHVDYFLSTALTG